MCCVARAAVHKAVNRSFWVLGFHLKKCCFPQNADRQVSYSVFYSGQACQLAHLWYAGVHLRGLVVSLVSDEFRCVLWAV